MRACACARVRSPVVSQTVLRWSIYSKNPRPQASPPQNMSVESATGCNDNEKKNLKLGVATARSSVTHDHRTRGRSPARASFSPVLRARRALHVTADRALSSLSFSFPPHPPPPLSTPCPLCDIQVRRVRLCVTLTCNAYTHRETLKRVGLFCFPTKHSTHTLTGSTRIPPSSFSRTRVLVRN